MAIGRISGPLLKANLVRDGVDLAFETDLLYLDVTNSRIGVNTPTPTADLDVNGTIRTTNINVDNSLTVGDITFSGSTITSTSTFSILSAAGQATVYHAKLQIDDLQITDNTISTNISNSNIELVPNGTGIVDIQSNSTISGNLDVDGDISATGSVIIGGNIILGDEVTDTITINASIAGDLIPDTTSTYDIGTPTNRWRFGYFNNFSVSNSLTLGSFTFTGNTITSTDNNLVFSTPNGNSVVIDSILDINDLRISGNTISTSVSNSSIDIRPNGAGTVELEANTNITGDLSTTGNVTVSSDLTVVGNTVIGTDSSNTITLNSVIEGNLVPATDGIYDIGSPAKRWGELFVTNLDSAGLSLGSFEFIGNTITSSESSIFLNTPNGNSVIFNSKLLIGDFEIDNNVISTVNSNSSIDIRPNGTGTIELEGNTNVTGDAVVSGSVTAAGITINGNSILGDNLSDTITINSAIASNLIPDIDNNYDIGSSSKKYANGYFTDVFSSTLNLESLTISGNTIEITTGSLNLNTPAGESVIVNSKLSVGDFEIDNNIISTTVSNASIDIQPNGTGTVELQADTNITGELTTTGNVTINGDLTVNGNSTLGSDNTDTLTINARLSSDIVPSIDSTYDVGEVSQKWNNGYFNVISAATSLSIGSFTFTDNTITSTDSDIYFNTLPENYTIFNSKVLVGDLEFDNNTISTTVSNASIDIQPNGTGTVELEADTNITGNLNVTGNIQAVGNITIGGNIIIGDSLADTVTINASITSDLIPETTDTYDLGSSSFYWKDVYTNTLYTNAISISSLNVGDLTFADNQISTAAGEDLLLDGNGSGGVQISNFLFSGNTITNVIAGAVSVIAQTGTGYFKIDTTNGFVPPVGTTAERPGTPPTGMTRYNSQTEILEIYNGVAWVGPAGSGGAVTIAQVEDTSAAYALILG